MSRENYRGIPVPVWDQDAGITADRAFRMGVDKALEESFSQLRGLQIDSSLVEHDLPRVFLDDEGDEWFEVTPNGFVLGFDWPSAEKSWHRGQLPLPLNKLGSQFGLVETTFDHDPTSAW